MAIHAQEKSAESVEVGDLPFDMKGDTLDYESLARIAHKPTLNSEGVVILPADWDDDERRSS